MGGKKKKKKEGRKEGLGSAEGRARVGGGDREERQGGETRTMSVESVETSKVLFAAIARKGPFVGVQGGVTLAIMSSGEAFAADVADKGSGKGGKKER
jgi:hypothetical protein